MKLIGYWAFQLLIGLFWLIPFRAIYIFSDFLAFLFFHVFTYRKSMIIKNLKASFPDKSEKEIVQICKESYRNISDILLEAIKGFTLSKKTIGERYQFRVNEELNEYFEKGQSVIGATAHLANWEWGAMASGFLMQHKILGVYKKVSHPQLNALMIRSRGKFDVELSEMKETSDKVKAYTSDRPFLLMLIADQSPSNPYKAYWTNFLNQETPFFYGAEKFAFEYKLPVFFFIIHRVKRGYYYVTIEKLSGDPTNLSKGDIIEKYKEVLEREILDRPSEWLWSHNRWKHKKPADFKAD